MFTRESIDGQQPIQSIWSELLNWEKFVWNVRNEKPKKPNKSLDNGCLLSFVLCLVEIYSKKNLCERKIIQKKKCAWVSKGLIINMPVNFISKILKEKSIK